MSSTTVSESRRPIVLWPLVIVGLLCAAAGLAFAVPDDIAFLQGNVNGRDNHLHWISVFVIGPGLQQAYMALGLLSLVLALLVRRRSERFSALRHTSVAVEAISLVVLAVAVISLTLEVAQFVLYFRPP